jgi:hypothetical protein
VDVAIIKKLIEKAYPELGAGYHLPRYGKVVGIRETPKEGDYIEEFRPRYAVDVQLLDQYGQMDKSMPVLKDVPLPLQHVGHESGNYSYPENGTRVQIGFAYGSPNNPFISHYLAHEKTLPELHPNEQRQQNNSHSYTRTMQDGSFERVTDHDILENSLKRTVKALEVIEEFTAANKTVEANDVEDVGVAKRIRTGKLFEVVSDDKQSLKSPKTWIGSDGENLLAIVSDLAQVVADLAQTLASHTHPTVGAPTQAAAISAHGTTVTDIKNRNDGIKL